MAFFAAAPALALLPGIARAGPTREQIAALAPKIGTMLPGDALLLKRSYLCSLRAQRRCCRSRLARMILVRRAAGRRISGMLRQNPLKRG